MAQRVEPVPAAVQTGRAAPPRDPNRGQRARSPCAACWPRLLRRSDRRPPGLRRQDRCQPGPRHRALERRSGRARPAVHGAPSRLIQRTAVARTRMPGGVGGGSRKASPYPDLEGTGPGGPGGEGRRAGDRVDQVMAAQLQEPAVVGPLLAHEDRVQRGLHVVVDASGAGALEQGEGPVMGVEHPRASARRSRPLPTGPRSADRGGSRVSRGSARTSIIRLWQSRTWATSTVTVTPSISTVDFR